MLKFRLLRLTAFFSCMLLSLAAYAADSDLDGMTDEFETTHGFDSNKYDHYRKIIINAPEWVPSVNASADIFGLRTEYTCTFTTNVTYSDLSAGERIVVHLDFESPLFVSNTPPDYISMSVDCEKQSPLGSAGNTESTMTSTGTMPLSLGNAGFYTSSGEISAFWINISSDSQLSEGEYCSSIVGSLVLNSGYSVQDIVLNSITFTCSLDGYNPDATYADFPVKAIPPSTVAPPTELEINRSVEVSFDTAVGFVYNIQQKNLLGGGEWGDIDKVIGSGSRVQKNYRVDMPSSFFRVTVEPIEP